MSGPSPAFDPARQSPAARRRRRPLERTRRVHRRWKAIDRKPAVPGRALRARTATPAAPARRPTPRRGSGSARRAPGSWRTTPAAPPGDGRRPPGAPVDELDPQGKRLAARARREAVGHEARQETRPGTQALRLVDRHHVDGTLTDAWRRYFPLHLAWLSYVCVPTSLSLSCAGRADHRCRAPARSKEHTPRNRMVLIGRLGLDVRDLNHLFSHCRPSERSTGTETEHRVEPALFWERGWRCRLAETVRNEWPSDQYKKPSSTPQICVAFADPVLDYPHTVHRANC